MDIKEMHIEVSQATQSIAANTRRKLQPEEIDWLLNKNMERFVQSRVKSKDDGSGSFQVDQMDVDSIRTLLKTEEITPHINGDEAEVILPHDYSYLLSDESYSLDLCGTTKPSAYIKSKQVTVLRIPLSTKVGAPYYVPTTTSILIGDSSLTIGAMLTEEGGYSSYTGFNSKEEVYRVRDFLITQLRQRGYKVWWEFYGDLYRKGAMIVETASVNPAASLTIDNVAAVGPKVTLTLRNYSNQTGKWRPNRLSRTSNIPSLLSTPFYTTHHLSPVSELTGNKLKVYTSSGFIVSKVKLNYVKNYRRMDLLLMQSCELPADFHQALCDLTVEYVKEMYADPSWEIKLRDNMTRQPNL